MDEQQFQEQFVYGTPQSINTFLQRIDLEDKTKYIQKIIYQEKISQGLALTRNILGYFWIPKIRSKIIICPEMQQDFQKNTFQNLEDFLSIIIDHEGFHAKQYYESPSEIGICKKSQRLKQYFKIEMQAYENQEKNFKKRNCSKEFQKYVSNIKLCCQNQLKFLNSKN